MKKHRQPDGCAQQGLADAASADATRTKHWDAWREENQAAINSMNRYVATHGLLSDKYRLR
jgi:post-segregation antitoxin (ccd killing protein)